MSTATKRRKKTTSITLYTKRWFNRSCGNTYHSVTIFVNGEQVHRVDFAYGYGQQYEWTAKSWLAKNGYLKTIQDNESLWRYCETHKIHYMTFVSDVGRKKDL
jgi:hypothetical protein